MGDEIWRGEVRLFHAKFHPIGAWVGVWAKKEKNYNILNKFWNINASRGRILLFFNFFI